MTLNQIIQKNRVLIERMAARKIKEVLDEMKFYLQEIREVGEVWEEILPENDLRTGILQDSFINFLEKILNRLIWLAENGKREEIDLTSNLLKRFITWYNKMQVPEEFRREQFFDDAGIAYGPAHKRTALGTFLIGKVLNNDDKKNKVNEALKTLGERKKGEEKENEINQQTPETGSEGTTGNGIPTETEVERKAREAIIKGGELAGSGNLSEVKETLDKLEAMAGGSQEERTAFNSWGEIGPEVINSLKSRKAALEIGNQTNDNTSQGNQGNSNNNRDNQLRQARMKALGDIIAVLNQSPKITDDKLSKNYQNWRETLKEIKDEPKIETFKNEVIADIQARRRDKQETNRFKNDVENAQGKTGEELRKDLENLKKGEGEKSYEEQREAVEQLSKISAQEDPENYQKMVVDLIKEKLTKNSVEESELEKDSEIKTAWEKIKKSEISQPEEIIAAENKITKKVGELGAQKRFDNLVKVANKALQSGEKKQLEKVHEEIMKFITSSNLYDQEVYSNQEKTIKELKSKLENYSYTPQTDSPSKFPWAVVVPISLLAILVVVVAIVVSKKKLLNRI